MLVYWFLYVFPLFFLIFGRRLSPNARIISCLVVCCFFVFVIGLRYQVGGDWFSYLEHLHRTSTMSFSQVVLHGDPGYYLLNWCMVRVGGGIYAVNTVCGLLLIWGVASFSFRQPLPWLAFLVAVPYLIIVVGMGYTRQAAALGFVLLAFVALTDKKIYRFVGLVMLAATFHKSAVLVLPMAALASTERRFWNFFWIAVISIVGGYLFLFDSVDVLWANYVEAGYESQGGLIRVLMNAISAMFFIILSRSLDLKDGERRLWWWVSIFSLVCIPLVVISSTATDRVALYFIPLQLLVFSRLHMVTNDALKRAYIVISVVIYYATVQAVWLLFATHAHAWLPYKMYPFAS